MHANDLFTAPQVARICSTDLKTIHNWVNRGEIRFFRTPGRHLRFRREDILDFLEKFGYPVPEGFAATRPRVVVIDRSESKLKSLKRALARDFEVEVFPDHVDALLSIGRTRTDLVLVNGADGQESMHVARRLSSTSGPPLVAVYGKDGKHAKGGAQSPVPADFIPNADNKQIRQRAMEILGR